MYVRINTANLTTEIHCMMLKIAVSFLCYVNQVFIKKTLEVKIKCNNKSMIIIHVTLILWHLLPITFKLFMTHLQLVNVCDSKCIWYFFVFKDWYTVTINKYIIKVLLWWTFYYHERANCNVITYLYILYYQYMMPHMYWQFYHGTWKLGH